MKVYIIIKGWGEYSDRNTEPVKVYRSKEQAEGAMVALEKIQSQNGAYWKDGSRRTTQLERDQLGGLMKKQYAELGFEADWEDDWELAEAELVE